MHSCTALLGPGDSCGSVRILTDADLAPSVLPSSSLTKIAMPPGSSRCLGIRNTVVLPIVLSRMLAFALAFVLVDDART